MIRLKLNENKIYINDKFIAEASHLFPMDGDKFAGYKAPILTYYSLKGIKIREFKVNRTVIAVSPGGNYIIVCNHQLVICDIASGTSSVFGNSNWDRIKFVGEEYIFLTGLMCSDRVYSIKSLQLVVE